MICTKCEADNPPGRSTCTACSQPLSQSDVTFNLPKMFLREPASSLYVIRSLSFKEMSNGVPPLDLRNVPCSDWPNLFDELRSVQFALCSNLHPELDAMVTSNDGFLFIQNNSKLKFKKNKPFPVGPATITVQIPDAPSGEVLALDLKVANSTEVANVAKTFFEHPRELLTRHNWQPYDDGSSGGSNPSAGQSTGLSAVPITTYFVTDGFEL